MKVKAFVHSIQKLCEKRKDAIEMARGLNRKRKKGIEFKTLPRARCKCVMVTWSLPGRRSFSRQKWQECNFSKQRFAKEKKEKKYLQ